MKNSPLLSIVIPCFNEEGRILKKFPKAYELIKSKVKSFELILVNDGSKDQTEKILKQLEKKYSHVKAISYHPNRGKGYAVKTGVISASGQLIGFTDADFAISLKDLDKVVDLLSGDYDVVVGDRKSNLSEAENANKFRRIFSKVHNSINNFFVGLGPIKDTTCGFKFFKGRVAHDLFKNLKTDRWVFDLEILISARQKKYKICQIPVSWEELGDSKFDIKKQSVSLIKENSAVYMNFFNLKIFLSILLPIIIVVLLPSLINPNSLVKRSGDYSDLV